MGTVIPISDRMIREYFQLNSTVDAEVRKSFDAECRGDLVAAKEHADAAHEMMGKMLDNRSRIQILNPETYLPMY